jgi:hypothetical protein
VKIALGMFAVIALLLFGFVAYCKMLSTGKIMRDDVIEASEAICMEGVNNISKKGFRKSD